MAYQKLQAYDREFTGRHFCVRVVEITKSSSSSPTNRNSLNRWNVASQMVGVGKPKGTQDFTCLLEILK